VSKTNVFYCNWVVLHAKVHRYMNYRINARYGLAPECRTQFPPLAVTGTNRADQITVLAQSLFSAISYQFCINRDANVHIDYYDYYGISFPISRLWRNEREDRWLLSYQSINGRVRILLDWADVYHVGLVIQIRR